MTAAAHSDGDELLVARLVDGDQDALGAVYDRYADRIHDFCVRMLHDPADAADATHDTFLVAARRAETLRERSKLRSWLYAIARTQCLGRLRARKRTEPSDDLEPMMDGDHPGRGAEQAEVAALVHAAAAGLEERDRAALHLHLRHDLDGQALAEAMGVTPANARKIAQRVRDRLERSLTALVVARKGSDDCEELAAILGDWDGELTPLLRKRVSRHVDSCETCDERRSRALTPAALLAAVPLAPAPVELRTRLVSSWASGAEPPGAAVGSWDNASGFPAGPRRAGRSTAMVSAAVVVAAFLAGIVLGVVTEDDEPDVETVATPAATDTSTLDTSPSGAADSTTTTIPTTSTAPTTSATATTRPTTTTSGPSVIVVDPPAVTEPDDQAPPHLTVRAEPSTIHTRSARACDAQPTVAVIIADVADTSGVAFVRFRWDGPEDEEQRLDSDAPYEVDVGGYPSSTLGRQNQRPIVVDVEARDVAGNVSTTTVELTLVPGTCIG